MDTVIISKICSKCKQLKLLEEFYWRDKAKGYRQSWCKACKMAHAQIPEVKKATSEYDKRRWQIPEVQIAHAESQKRRNQNSEVRRVRLEDRRVRRMIDIQYRLAGNLRSGLNRILRGQVKRGSAVRDLGCSISELMQHLERQWQYGMSWENYGNKIGQWSVDHKMPISKFDLTKREELLKAVHYTNLQPMWHIDNLKKGNRI